LATTRHDSDARLRSAVGSPILDAEGLDALRARFGDAYVGRRLRAQIDQIAQIHGAGEGRFHFENLPFFCRAVGWGLTVSGLRGATRRHAERIELSESRFTFPDLPHAFDGLRVLHLSDLHLDAVDGLGRRIAQVVAQARFDVAVVTGDFRFHDTGRYEHLRAELDALVPALACRWGVFGILGNHDVLEMVPLLEASGVRMLVNECEPLELGGASLALAGVDDAHLYGAHDLDAAFRGVSGDTFRVLLAHSPEIAEEALEHGVRLYLTGHTHGGQLCLPGCRPVIVNARCPRDRVRGPWRYERVHGYTSRGTGCSGVFARLFCPPEVVVHEIRGEERSFASDRVHSSP
jgi:hypothetical protein